MNSGNKIKREIRKKQRSQDAFIEKMKKEHEIRNIKFEVSMFAINILFVVFMIFLNKIGLTTISALLLVSFELAALAILVKQRKTKDFEPVRYLGLWTIIPPFGMGGYFMSKYDYYTYENLHRFVAFSAALAIAVFVAYLWKKGVEIDYGVVVYVFLSLLLAISFWGQIMMINDVLPAIDTVQKEYYVADKEVVYYYKDPFSHRMITLEYDKDHWFEVEVNKVLYKKISKGDTFSICVYTGGLGIDYVITTPSEIETQIKEKEKINVENDTR